MTGDAQRIRTLRERAGKSADEIALLAGLGDMAYHDLESYDDELRTVLSLEQVKLLAVAIGVPTSALFSDEATIVGQRISHDELVRILRAHLASGVSRDTFEEEIGWDLDTLFESEAAAISGYPAEFLEAVCSRIGVAWIAALP